MAFVIPRLEAVQYDGTNGESIASEFLTGMTVGSDDGQVLQLVDGMNDPQINRGDWVIRRPTSAGRFQYLGAYSDTDFQAVYTVLP